MKKAVFAYSFSDKNAGDFSLNIAAVDILIKSGYFVTIISRFEAHTFEYKSTSKYFEENYPGTVKMISSPFRLDRAANISTKIANYFQSLLVSLSLLKNTVIEHEIKEADAVVLCGGNILRCEGVVDYMRLLALYYPLGLARKHNKEYVIFPQSTSEINKLGKGLLGKIVNNAKMVFIREDLSYKKITTMFPDANVKETLDLAFFLLDENLFLPSNRIKSVAFTIRADTLGGLAPVSLEEEKLISNQIINTTLKLIEFCKVTYVIQGTEEDSNLTRKIASTLHNKHGVSIPVIEERDTYKLIELYATFDLLIGMRLHSVILAAISGTPSYGFFKKEWGLKNPGILNQVGLPMSYIEDNKAIELSDLTELMDNKSTFQSMIKKLVKTERETIFNTLR